MWLTYLKLSSNSAKTLRNNMLSSLTSLWNKNKVYWICFFALLGKEGLPDVALFISEDSEQELAVAVGYIGLGYHDVIPRGKCKKGDYFSCNRVIGYIQRLLHEQSFKCIDWTDFFPPYMFSYVDRCETSHVWWHFIHGKANVMQFSFFPLFDPIGALTPLAPSVEGRRVTLPRVGLVLLGHTHHYVALDIVGPGDLNVKLGIHGSGVWNLRIWIKVNYFFISTLPICWGEPPALYPDRHLRRASTALQGFLLCKADSLIQSSGPMWTRSRWENCLAKSSKAIQNSPSFRTRADKSSLSRSDKLSHSHDLSLHGPFHSPFPQGFLSLTRWVSPSCPLTLAKPVTL